MNTENILKLADMLLADAPPMDGLGFYMPSYWRHDTGKGCGTAACIAGWAAIAGGMEPPPPKGSPASAHPIVEGAMEWLGLDAEKAGELFTPSHERSQNYIPLEDIDAAWAARTLQHLAETGRVDWPATAPEGYER